MIDVEDPRTADLVVAHAAALQEVLPIVSGRTRSRRLYKGDDVTVVGVAMDAGAEMREHVAAAPVLLHVVGGRIAVDIDGRRTDLPAGGILRIPARQPHAVTADVESRFLLLLLGSGADAGPGEHR